MALGKNVSQNIKQLYKDNKKKGKARGANGKVRSRKQIIAIALRAAGKMMPGAMPGVMKNAMPSSMKGGMGPVSNVYDFTKARKKLGVVKS